LKKDLIFQEMLGQVSPREEYPPFPLSDPKGMGLLDLVAAVTQSK
jgi:hypothetical protein